MLPHEVEMDRTGERTMILNRKNRRQALLRIIACLIITSAEVKNEESLTKMTENLADLAYYVGGIKGINKVINELEAYDREEK